MEYTDFIEYEIADRNSDKDADFDNDILWKKLQKVCDELNEEDQMIFNLRFVQDLSWECNNLPEIGCETAKK